MANVSTIEIGSAGVRYAAGMLGNAVCAEACTATMSEDAAKVDLKFSFRDVFAPANLISVHCQVKSGGSFRKKGKNSENFAIAIGRDTVAALSGGSKPALLVWVPPEPSPKVYRHIFGPVVTGKTVIPIQRHEVISPGLRYDLSRAHAHNSQPSKVRVDMAKTVSINLKDVKEEFRRFKEQSWTNPLVGPFKISRHTWMHISRKSVIKPRREKKFRLLPYLGSFIEDIPDRYNVSIIDVSDTRRFRCETRLITCWYRSKLRVNGKPETIVIRFKEKIIFPRNWYSRPLRPDQIRSEVVLETWWMIN